MRMWWGDRKQKGHRASNRKDMETTLNCVMNDKYQVPFVTYVCGKDNYDYLKSKGLEDLVLVTEEPRLDIPVELDAQHRLYLCDIAMQDFREIICVNWDCRLVRPFTDNAWTQLRKKEAIQASLIGKSNKVVFLKSRGEDGHIFSIDGFLYLRDYTLPKKILKLLDDPDVPHKWTSESLISIYLDRLHGGWIGPQRYYELYEPDCFYAGRLGLWKCRTKKNICFAYQRHYKWKQDIS